MDPLTAFSTGLSVFSSLLSFGSSAPDPSRVAIFETYKGVQILNERAANIEGGLITIHEAVLDLSTQLGDQNNIQTDIEATDRLISAIGAIVRSYNGYLNDIADPSVTAEQAESKFKVDRLDNEQQELEKSLNVVLQTAPLSLDIAIAATAFEFYSERRTNPGIFNPIGRTKERMSQIRSVMATQLASIISMAKQRMKSDRVEVEKLLTIGDWNTRTKAIVYNGSWFAPWQEIVTFQCLHFDKEAVYEENNLFLFVPTSSDPTSIVRLRKQIPVSGKICEAAVSNDSKAKASSKRIKVEGTAITATHNPGRLDLKSLTKGITPTQYGNFWVTRADLLHKKMLPIINKANSEVQKAVQRSDSAFTIAMNALNRANISTARYALLMKYQDGLKGALAQLEVDLNALAEIDSDSALDIAFSNELKDLSAFSEQDIYTVLHGYHSAANENAKRVFRNQIAEAALAADERMQVSVKRVSGAIEAYNNRPKIHDHIKRLTVALSILETTIKFADALTKTDGKSQTKNLSSATKKAAVEIEKAGSTKPKRKATEVERERGKSNYERAVKLINKLKALGPPVGNPNDTNDLTQQELMAERLLEILNTWEPTKADKELQAHQAAQARAYEKAWDAALMLKPGALAKIILRETLRIPVMGSSEPGSISTRNKLRKEALPLINKIRDWRVGI